MGINFNSGFNPSHGTNFQQQNAKQEKEENKGILSFYTEEIPVLTTGLTENNRTSFDFTFEETEQKDNKAAKEFVFGLSNYKKETCAMLGISREKYDALSCVSLAFATQETGMGKENGYERENTFPVNVARGFVKLFDSTSASSGLSQIKINDYLDPNKNKLTQDEIDFIRYMGVTTDIFGGNNLYSRPDLSALCTVVVVNHINNHYDNYLIAFNQEHQNLAKKLTSSTNLSEEECYQKGEEVMDGIIDIYSSIENDDEKVVFREALKSWFLAKNGSKKGDRTEKGYNEEENLQNLNNIISRYSDDFQLTQDDLDYIRFYMTDDKNKFTRLEAIPYFYNNGTGETAMQLDRYLACKIGDFLPNPEVYSYDQYVQNVSGITMYYAEKLGFDAEYIESVLAK